MHTFPHRGTAVTPGRITFADQSRKNTSTIRQREALQKDGGFPRQDFRKTCSRAGRDQRECIFRAVRNKLVLGKFLYVENIIPMPMSEDELADVLTQVTSLCQLIADSDPLVLLCYKCGAPQKGQLESCRRRTREIVCRSVAIEPGLCRSRRTRRPPRTELGRNFGDG